MEWETPIDIAGIKRMQQNRYPLLFIDRIDGLLPGKWARATKNFTYNEWFFPPHFDSEPSVPGFVQIECLAQTFLSTFLTIPGNAGLQTAFVGLNNVRFRRKVIPGDQMSIYAELVSFRRGVAYGNASSTVGLEDSCSAELIIAVPDILNRYLPRSEQQENS